MVASRLSALACRKVFKKRHPQFTHELHVSQQCAFDNSPLQTGRPLEMLVQDHLITVSEEFLTHSTIGVHQFFSGAPHAYNGRGGLYLTQNFIFEKKGKYNPTA